MFTNDMFCVFIFARLVLIGLFLYFQDREKHDQLSDILNNYSSNGIPDMPNLLKLGRPTIQENLFEIEPHWSSVVENASVRIVHTNTLKNYGVFDDVIKMYITIILGTKKNNFLFLFLTNLLLWYISITKTIFKNLLL